MVVHRPPDSRLLTNLIAHEKEYTKHFVSLFPLSHAALASLSAYSAASPSENPYSSNSGSPAQVLAAIVDVLAGADDALQRYLHVVEKWREQLVSLKELEDDIGSILRDREILITRVIKLSKAQKSGRDSRSSFILHPGGSSVSFSSLPSTTNSTSIGSASSKLAHVQAELQACESHLADKERELAVRRISVVREGLGARCRALIDCGWVWSKMGKQGLHALQSLSGSLSESRVADPGIAFPRTHSPSPPRSPGYQKLDPSSANAPQLPISYASDLSSLTPSQSASQRASTSIERGQDEHNTHDQTEPSPAAPKAAEEDIFYQGHITVSIPPAHRISEFDVPIGIPTPKPTSPTPTASSSMVSALQTSASNYVTNAKQDTHAPGTGLRYTRSTHRRPISRHISEASDEGGQEDFNADGVSRTVPLPMSGPSRTGSDTNAPNAIVMRRSDSSDEFPRGPLEVVENELFASVRSKSGSLNPISAPRSERDQTPSPKLRKGKPRERTTSTTFLSSLRGLFSHRERTKGSGGPSAVWEGSLMAEPASSKSTSGWSTHIDRHLRGERDSTDSEAGPRPGIGRSLSRVSKLRKVRGQSMVRTPSSSGSPNVRPSANGWVTDGGNAQGSARGKSTRRKKSIAAWKGPDDGLTDGDVDNETDKRSHYGHSYSVQAKRSSFGKSVLSNASDAASSKRARRATTDFIDADSAVLSGTSLDANVRTPHPSHLSVGSPGNSSARAESPSGQKVSIQVQARPSSVTSRSTSPGRRGIKSGTLHTPNGSADQSLMSIVENVARQNRERNIASALATLNGHASSSNGNLPVLEVPRAPSLQVAQSSTAPGVSARKGPGQQVPDGRPRSLDLRRSESVPSTSRVNTASMASSSRLRNVPSSEVKGTPTSSAVGSNGTNPSTSSRLARVPLRSALRNASRTPSPNPVAITTPAIPSQGQNRLVTESNRARERSLEQVLSATQSSSAPDLRDSMSISSYETGRESPMSSPSSPSPTLLPPLSPAPVPHASLQDQSHGASSSVSTETPPTARRRSVRMSLKPTFSPPPPPLPDYDQLDEDENVNTWSDRPVEGWKTRTGSHAVAAAAPTDVWQDSSEEDEEYSRARRLLSRVTKGKGKV